MMTNVLEPNTDDLNMYICGLCYKCYHLKLPLNSTLACVQSGRKNEGFNIAKREVRNVETKSPIKGKIAEARRSW